MMLICLSSFNCFLPPLTDVDNDLFVSPQRAFNILAHNSISIRRKRGIVEECCHTNGCSWEEYAEYCTHNNRMRQ